MRLRLLSTILLLAAVVAAGCQTFTASNLPPAERLMHPGPGVTGPGPGVIPPQGGVNPAGYPGGDAMLPASYPGGMMGGPGGMMGPGGEVLGGENCYPGGPDGSCYPGDGGGAQYVGYDEGQNRTVQILFDKPESMQVRWDVTGIGQFDSTPLVTPGRYNFPQGGVYRLKLTNIEGRVGVELYPTLEIGPATPRSAAYLVHNAIPIQFTTEDFDQVLTGNYVTKVIYLPDPEFQELALAGVETLVSTRLDPGVDPIVEADRRGAILAIIRLGNIDLQMPQAIEGGLPAGGEAIQPGVLNSTGGPQMNATPVSFGNGPIGDGAQYAPQGVPAQPVGYGHPSGYAVGAPPSAIMPGGTAVQPYISGITGPQYGMPITGTPIGLPGPPHIPLGVPAGLQKHTMKNHTVEFYPEPNKRQTIHVKQKPGMYYPRPANTAVIKERAMHPGPLFRQSKGDRFQLLPGGQGDGSGAACPPGYCPPGQ